MTFQKSTTIAPNLSPHFLLEWEKDVQEVDFVFGSKRVHRIHVWVGGVGRNGIHLQPCRLGSPDGTALSTGACEWFEEIFCIEYGYMCWGL